MRFEWEMIYVNEHNITLSAEVIGGWLVRHMSWNDQPDDENEPIAMAMNFVSGPSHKWGKDPFEGAI